MSGERRAPRGPNPFAGCSDGHRRVYDRRDTGVDHCPVPIWLMNDFAIWADIAALKRKAAALEDIAGQLRHQAETIERRMATAEALVAIMNARDYVAIPDTVPGRV